MKSILYQFIMRVRHEARVKPVHITLKAMGPDRVFLGYDWGEDTFIFEKDIENTNQLYLLHYIGGDIDSLINLDLEIKLELFTEEKRAEVLYINDGFKTVYTKEKNKNKIHNWFIKWLWMLQDGRKECKK